ncbi:AVO3 protein [Aphelenchoides avenae]|nr:AVO3 protein [Aphelenchus avenae]
MLDLVTSSASMEYVKLIVSCLDYSRPGPARGVLETVLTASNEDFGDFGMGLLFRQLTDASPKVVRHAVRLLSTLVPKYPECLKQLSSVRFEAFGDAGALLESHLFVDEQYVVQHPEHAKRVVEGWSKAFNSRYVELVEDEMRVVFLNVKRSLDGRFARVSNERLERRSLKAPNHLFGSLAKHSAGRKLLLEKGVVESLVSTLERQPTTEERCLEAKSALLALGHIIGNLPTDSSIDWDVAKVITLMVHQAESSTWLSIRGIAFWALTIAGESDLGSEALESVGWCNNRRAYLPSGKSILRSKTEARYLSTTCRLTRSYFSRALIRAVKLKTGDRITYLTRRSRQSLAAYRRVLAEAGEIAAFNDVFGSDRSMQVPTSVNGAPKIVLPSNVRRLSQGIFAAGTENTGRIKATAVNVMQGHVTDRCFICRRGKDPADFIRSEVDKAYHEQRAEVLHIVSMLEIRENANQNRLLKIFKEADVFAHPCLYADVLELMVEFTYSTDSRKLLHQLFWPALQLR